MLAGRYHVQTTTTSWFQLCHELALKVSNGSKNTCSSFSTPETKPSKLNVTIALLALKLHKKSAMHRFIGKCEIFIEWPRWLYENYTLV